VSTGSSSSPTRIPKIIWPPNNSKRSDRFIRPLLIGCCVLKRILLPHPPHGANNEKDPQPGPQIEISHRKWHLIIFLFCFLEIAVSTSTMPMIIQQSPEGVKIPSSPSKQSRIRMNYLTKLGINPTKQTTSILARRDSDISKSSLSSSISSIRRVRFDDDITTVHIPSHRDMDRRTRKRIWYNWAELQEAASRNAMDEWREADPVEKQEISRALAFIQATYQRKCQLQYLQSNKQLAIRNACLRPPVRPDQFMVWPQHSS
jgi:hypothetical protein